MNKTNWKDDFKKEFWDSELSDADGVRSYYLNDNAENPNKPIEFISNLLEKLIEESFMEFLFAKQHNVDFSKVLAQLRVKWLGKE